MTDERSALRGNDLFGDEIHHLPMVPESIMELILDGDISPTARLIGVWGCQHLGYPHTTAELADDLGIHRTTVARVLPELVEHGWVVKDTMRKEGNKPLTYWMFMFRGTKTAEVGQPSPIHAMGEWSSVKETEEQVGAQHAVTEVSKRPPARPEPCPAPVRKPEPMPTTVAAAVDVPEAQERPAYTKPLTPGGAETAAKTTTSKTVGTGSKSRRRDRVGDLTDEEKFYWTGCRLVDGQWQVNPVYFRMSSELGLLVDALRRLGTEDLRTRAEQISAAVQWRRELADEDKALIQLVVMQQRQVVESMDPQAHLPTPRDLMQQTVRALLEPAVA